jgi:4-aminobutyrate aminotransferase-like enzyme
MACEYAWRVIPITNISMMQSHKILDLLSQYECRNILFKEPDGSWPIVWARAKNNYVWDADGKRYLDLTAAFGVAACGHANPRVTQAACRQMKQLTHAMGDVHPHALKAQLAQKLSQLTFERWFNDSHHPCSGKSIFCNSGFEAVEAAIKTAALYTGKKGVVAFEHAYHGLGYGSLNVTHRDHFRGPFISQLAQFGHFVPFPDEEKEVGTILTAIQNLCQAHEIGAVLVEPIQGRGGIHVPPDNFLPKLRQLCDSLNLVLIFDEIYTGFGRTGKWFACEHRHAFPDIICLGKALTGGFPLSACVGRSDLMDTAWPAATGEAIHTSTFLGHPVGCAMALAQISELSDCNLIEQSAVMGSLLFERLAKLVIPQPFAISLRGKGLMLGMELHASGNTSIFPYVWRIVKDMLQRGFILLPEGDEGTVISFTPPLTINRAGILRTVSALQESFLNILVA